MPEPEIAVTALSEFRERKRPLAEPAEVSEDQAVPTAGNPSPLPSGTVTFLLTDIEGFSRLWEAHGPAMKAAVARHYDILGRDPGPRPQRVALARR